MRGRSRRAIRAREAEQERVDVVEFDGGEDLVTPALKVNPGRTLLSLNYEAAPGEGYSRTGNFESFDGQDKPHEAEYHTLDFELGGTSTPQKGDVITGTTSGAFGTLIPPYVLEFTGGTAQFFVGDDVVSTISTGWGKVVWVEVTSGSIASGDLAGKLYIHRIGTEDFPEGDIITSDNGQAISSGPATSAILHSGTWLGGDAAGRMYLYDVVGGPFLDGETLEVLGSGVHVATADGDSVLRGEDDFNLDRAASLFAIQATRDVIEAVPGAGPIRGIVSLNGDVFAFRDNVGQTELHLYKATANGWTLVTFPSYLDFDAGTGPWTVGDTLNGGISSASATVDAVFILSGTTGGGNQKGRLYISGITGTFQNNEPITSPLFGTATADGVVGTVTLDPGGYVESVVHNFKGTAGTRRIYGVDGVNDGWEFDGTSLYPYPNGFGVAPSHVIAHKDYLVMAFESSVGHSALGEPRDWTAISGAVEIATGDEVTGFAHSAGGVLTIFNRSSTYLLYGDVATEWQLRLHSADSGAIEHTIQEVGGVIYMDDPGLMELSATQDFGDFKESTISKDIEPYLRSRRKDVVASMRVKDKNQYRLFFSDGTGLHVRIDRKKPAFTRVKYGDRILSATLSTTDSSGDEILFFGDSEGFVHQLDVGRSADGLPIEAYLRLPFWTMGSPLVKKRFLQATFQLTAPEVVSMSFTAEFDYGSSDIERSRTLSFSRTLDLSVDAGGGLWDVSLWGDFIWSAQTTGEAIAYLQGSGTNMGMLIYHKSASELNHTIETAIVRYIPRGLKR